MGPTTPPEPEQDPSAAPLPAYADFADPGRGAPGPRPGVPGPLGIGDTVRAALGLYGADALTLWKIVAAVVIPVQALIWILRVITVPNGSIARDAKIYVQPGVSDGGFVAISTLGELLLALALLVCVGATYRILLGRHLHHPTDLMTSFSFGVERVLPLLWVSILVGVLVFVGFILIIIPGVYLFVSFVAAVPVLMAEDRRGFSALQRSRELVADNWWRVFGVILVAALVAAVGEFVIGLIAGAIIRTVAPHSIDGLLLISGIVNALVSILLYPFATAVPVVLYVDLLLRKDDPQLDRLLA